MNYDEEYVKDNQIDERKLTQIKMRVMNLERQNYTTKKLTDNQMVENIIQIINREVQNDN